MAELLTLDGQRLPNDWQRLADDAPLPANGNIIVSQQRWENELDALKAFSGKVGVELLNTVNALELPKSVLQAELIALQFPAFTDGRAYSQARLLRERLNYSGPIRACGDVLHDQLFYMARCGFDEFEWPGNLEEETLQKALNTFATAYQPTHCGPELGSTGIIKGVRA